MTCKTRISSHAPGHSRVGAEPSSGATPLLLTTSPPSTRRSLQSVGVKARTSSTSASSSSLVLPILGKMARTTRNKRSVTDQEGPPTTTPSSALPCYSPCSSGTMLLQTPKTASLATAMRAVEDTGRTGT
eukprot:GSA120T00015477001.1